MNKAGARVFRFLFYPAVKYLDSRFQHLDLRCDQLLRAIQGHGTTAAQSAVGMDHLLPILLDNISKQNAASMEAVRIGIDLQKRLDGLAIEMKQRLDESDIDQVLPTVLGSISSQNAASRESVRIGIDLQERLADLGAMLSGPSQDDKTKKP